MHLGRIGALVVAAALASPTPGAERDARPPDGRRSVVVVTVDTLRADRVGCYGAAGATTPTLDRLAREGVRFERVTSPAPLTVPAHASLFTGRVPRRHGARDNARFVLPSGVPTLAERLAADGWSTAAAVGSFVLDRGAGLARGFADYDDDVRVGAPEEFAWEERSATAVTDAAVARLAELRPPFFLWVHYYDPHAPYVPPEPHRGRHAGRPYDGEVAYVDAELDRLLAAVRRVAPDAWIAVVGDHGESLGEHGEATHGLFLYEATQRVPWILAGAGAPRGRVVRTRVGLVDVAPTLLDLLGRPALADTDGRSLAKAVLGGSEPDGSAYEMETLYPWLSYGWAPLHALVADERKYVEAPRPELYDLREDPGERRDLARERPDRVAPLARDLARRLAEDTVEGARSQGPEAAERRRRLESLGYVAGGAASPTGDESVDPKDGVAWLADLDRARARSADGDPAGCADALRPLLARNPDNVPALLTLAACRLASGDARGALAAADAAERVAPDDDLAAFHRANALAALAASGDVDPAVVTEAYERAVALHPRRPATWLRYAAFASGTRGPEAALAILDRADRAGVVGPDLDVARAVDLLRIGRAEPAEAAFRRALSRNPADVATLEALARLRLKAGDAAGAIPYLRPLLEATGRWDVARELGLALAATGDRDGAIATLDAALAATGSEGPGRDALERARREVGGE